MQSYIQTLLGNLSDMKAKSDATVHDLKRKIQEVRMWLNAVLRKTGAAIFQSHAHQHQPSPLLVRGMISTFTSRDSSDPLTKYLMLSDEERQSVPVPLEELRQKKERLKLTEGFFTFRFQPDCSVLDDSVCILLSNFLDYMWKNNETRTEEAQQRRVDMRLAFPDEECFLRLVGALDKKGSNNKILHDLKQIYQNVPGANSSPKVALRMTVGPTNACIDFHCDGEYASSTSQIALNSPDEYMGGRLCYFVNDTLHVLERPKGSLVQHPPRVLHAVTALTLGIRKSLFVVDQENGLGENGVVEITSQHVAGYLSHMLSQGLSQQGDSKRSGSQNYRICIMCHEEQADHILIPCGHIVFCAACVEPLPVTTCPVCRASINDCIRAYL